MKHLKVRNIGPIQNIDILLNKLNIFMGAQSSGKSTITKIACYCSWVEKKLSTTPLLMEQFIKKNYFVNELVRFHKLEGYLSNDSYIFYETEIIKIEYLHSKKTPTIEFKNRLIYKKSKISYIPSERNIIATVPNWMEIKFIDNNVRSFMTDWGEARQPYTKENQLKILNLEAKYHFDSSSSSDRVAINKQGKTLELTNTSSGLQSLIPLSVLLDYYYSWIYDNETPKSVSELFENEKIDWELTKHTIDVSTPTELIKFYEDIRRIAHARKKATDYSKEEEASIISLFSLFNELNENFQEIQYTNVFLEEPEQNLFPRTQRDLVYKLVEIINQNENHTLTITTHSPYILYALNNCMMGYNVKDSMPEDEKNELASHKSWIDPSLVSIWEIDESKGEVNPINKTETGTVSDHYLNQIMKEVADEYYDMLDYIKL
jgi:hypothetical protein